MKVLAIVPYLKDTSPGQRYRIEQWEPLLAKRGVEITYAPFEYIYLNKYIYTNGHLANKAKLVSSACFNRFKAILTARKYDLVYIYRECALIGPAVFEKFLAYSKIPIVYDFDDAIFLPNVSAANSKFSFLKSPQKVATICGLAGQVTVGNKFLAEYALQYNKNVTVVPSTIDTEKYFPAKNYNQNKIPVILWSGSTTTLEHLKTIDKVLQKLAHIKNFKLRIIGATDFRLKGVEVENIRWQSKTEIEDLSVGTIGIMPLPNDDWSKGKCGMKALQYMGMGIPTICSNVGANKEIVFDGHNGFLASNENEWFLKLKSLLSSIRLRKQIGEAGYKTISERYAANIHAPRMFQIFEKVLAAQAAKVKKL